MQPDCERVRKEIPGEFDDCCPNCHGSKSGEVMVLNRPTVLGTGETVHVCCRIARALKEYGQVKT